MTRSSSTQFKNFDGFPEKSTESKVDVDFDHYLRLLRKYKWFVFLSVLLATTVAAYYAQTSTPTFRSTSTLLIESEINDPAVQGWVDSDTENDDYYQTQFELLKSRELASRVVKSMDLLNHRDFRSVRTPSDSDLLRPDGTSSRLTVLEQRENLVVTKFLKRLTVVPVRRTKLIRIRFESPDPEFAAEVANAIGEQYILSHLEARTELSNRVADWTNLQLSSLKQKLDESEAKVVQFKQDNGLVDLNGSVSRLNEQELGIYTSELARARAELSDAADLRREMQSYNGDPRLLETIPAVQSDPIVRDAKIDVGRAQRELDELLNRYGDRHPLIVDAKSRLESLQSTIDSNVLRVVDSIEKDYLLLRQRVSSIQSQLQEGRVEVQALSAKNFELNDLIREAESNRMIYEQFFNRMTEANSADGLESANARIVDYAIPATSAFKPKKQLIIMLAAVVSLLLSLLMVFLYEAMDNTVKSARDVESGLGQRMLGLLPLLRSGVLKRPQTTPLHPLEIPDGSGPFFEAVNTIRTSILMDEESNADQGRVIVVTSSVPHEGKSTTTLNLAYAFSQVERVLLIDADLRRPTIADSLGFDRSIPGLSNLISNTGVVADCIQQAAIGDVDVICSGPIADRPLELLSSSRLESLLNQLRLRYDRIIIDCAPTHAVSDPLIVGKLADSAIYCIKSGSTSTDLVKQGINRLLKAKTNLLGVIMTQVDMEKLVSIGGDHYYQGYYDSYGYSETENDGFGRLQLTQNDLNEIKNGRDGYEHDFGFDQPDKSASYNVSSQFDSEFEATLLNGHDIEDRFERRKHAPQREVQKQTT